MVNSVSDVGHNTLIQSIINSSQHQLDDVQSQISSGLKAQTYAGLGGLATYQSLSLTSQTNSLTALTDGISAASNITSAMDSSMTGVTTAAQSVLTSLQSVVQGATDPGMTTFSAQAKNALAAVQSYLNTQSGSTYVFSASDASTAPVASTTALTVATQTDMAAYQAGTETASQLLTNIGSYTATQMGYSTTLAAATNVSVPTSATINTNYTAKANNAGFQNVMQGLSIIANLQYDSADASSFYTVYNGAIAQIGKGIGQVTSDQATLGVATKTMTDAQTQIASTQSVLSTAIGNVEDLSTSDMTAASTKLATLQTQLQASYAIISQLQNVHLIDYLDGSA